MGTYTKGCIYVVASAVIFGCMPLATKFLYANGTNAITTVFLRNLLATPILWLITRRYRPNTSLRIELAQAKKIGILALFGLVLTPMLLFSSYQFILTGAATTLHFNYPIFVLLGCVLFLGEKITRINCGCVILCLGGILLFYTPGNATNLLGVSLAFISGITYAFYVIYLTKSQMTQMYPFQLSLYLSLCASVLLFGYALITKSLAFPTTWVAWLVALLFSISLAVGAIVLFQSGTAIVGPQKAAIFSTFEPITSIIVGVLVFKEQLTLKIICGMSLILAAVILLTIYGKSEASPVADVQQTNAE